MKILYVSNLYHPEPGALPERVSQLSRNWVKMGHEVTVLTGYPNHPYGKVYSGYRRRLLRVSTTEWDEGVRVIRTPFIFRPNRGGANRAISFSSFAASAVLRSILTSKFDVVIGTFPQPLQAISGWLKARLNRSKFVLEVRDLWPETIVGTGLADERSTTYNFVLRVVKFLYSRADACVAVTDAARDSISTVYGVDKQIVSVVPAGVHAERFLAKTPRLDDASIRVVYSGTTGNSQGLEVLVRAAKIIQDSSANIRIEIIGGGAEWDLLTNLATELNVTNIDFTGQVDRFEVPELLSKSDIALAILRDSPVFKTAVPTKIYEYMAAGLPVVSNVLGEAENLVRNAGAGVTVAPGDPKELADAIIDLAARHSDRMVMSESGRRYVTDTASWEARAEHYLNVLERVVAK